MKRTRLFGRRRAAAAQGDAAAGETGSRDGGLDAYEVYHEALHAAEQAYDDARGAAEEAYHAAQAKADALIARGARLYEEAAERGRVHGAQAARGARDNKALALLLAAGTGYLLALAVKRGTS